MAAGNSSETRVLALLSQKGGSGKTTLAAHLAVSLGVGRRVVLVDTDPQRSAAVWWRARGKEAPELVETPAGEIIGAARRIGLRWWRLIVIDTMPSVAADIASIARAAVDPRPPGDRRHGRGGAKRENGGGHRVERDTRPTRPGRHR